MIPARARVAAVALVAVLLGGCGGYMKTVEAMNAAIRAGDIDEAVVRVSNEMDVDGPGRVPDDLTGDVPLLLLERATLLYAEGANEPSARDFGVADKVLEVLDLTNDAAGDVGKFLFSDDSGVYVAPPFEKLMLNSLNLLNYLSMGDMEGARVEARRLTIMQDLVKSTEGDKAAVSGLGSYAAGFAFEMSNRVDEALRYYDEALAAQLYASLREPVRRLAALTSYRSDRIDALLASADGPAEVPPEESGDLLVVVALGRVPHKVPERIPIGLALTFAASASGQYAMTPAAREQAAMLAARGLLTWVNFPSLAETPTRFEKVSAELDQHPLDLELGVDTADQARQSFEALRPVLIVSAITRTITRVLAGIAAEEGTKAAGGQKGLGLLIGLALQGGLTAADTPDTRSWVTLPGSFWIGRARVPAGPHEVRFTASGQGGAYKETRKVSVPAGSYQIVTFTLLN